ncbi:MULTISPECIES: hypothetical protein [unclassified Streptomyces]|uniref:hypothetical protein n=1 Tax=unclassified Streptomyces TaxID=2593676 RepID=UPI002E34791B|nr:hypothetical protein [Streptomyces sp. NBC_01477]
MTQIRMTTHSTRPWAAGRPHKHARAGRLRHHAAASMPVGRIILLSAAVLLVLAAALVVALG